MYKVILMPWIWVDNQAFHKFLEPCHFQFRNHFYYFFFCCFFFAQDSIHEFYYFLKRGILPLLHFLIFILIIFLSLYSCLWSRNVSPVLFTKPEQVVHLQTNFAPIALFWWSATYSDSRYLFILCCFESKIFLLCFQETA